MKKALKITLSIVLVLALIFTSATVTAYFAKNSVYFYDIQDWFFETNAIKVLFKDCPLWRYYDKVPNGLSYEGQTPPDIEEIFADMNKKSDISIRCVARCTFIKKVTNVTPEERAEFVFEVNEVVIGKYPYSELSICYPREDFSYYTGIEQTFNYYGVGYEEGEEYLLFLITDTSYNTLPQGMEYAVVDGVKTKDRICDYHILIHLGTDAPCIELYPGAVRYDATYFGAGTKNVTADEFVMLVKQEIESSGVK